MGDISFLMFLCVLYLSAGVSTCLYYVLSGYFPQPSHKEPAVNKKDNPAELPFLTNLPKAIAYSGFPDFLLSESKR